ncbi:Pre-mRNA-splicing factor cwc22 [Neolecta irregularis DAH-3]|uniref:Pre-mRNA-splicing factor cwc22 n=1 Tax=Neolecta irregularis (strain DAH-3) TaxID=1198029 RepID=A0A1U7LHV7_NEOID|nr:Pre-mRNA-splicing factor cwc22 [Neolecta irregularis DAH-3]|eukprot:OLL22229.1 Pre-mRNA-splicing factor cwc22 [Neolecta irregularis DAH-3]
MIIECCSQERTYSKFYGLIGERFCRLNSIWAETFEGSFQTYYDTIHRYETNRLRNIARFFGHLLSTDAISWTVLSSIKLNEDETTSSSRIFIKILFQDIGEAISVKKLSERLNDPFMKEATEGLFPLDEPRKTRFSINYFTSIGLGMVTEGMRETLKNIPALPAHVVESSDSESGSSSDSRNGDEVPHRVEDVDSPYHLQEGRGPLVLFAIPERLLITAGTKVKVRDQVRVLLLRQDDFVEGIHLHILNTVQIHRADESSESLLQEIDLQTSQISEPRE